MQNQGKGPVSDVCGIAPIEIDKVTVVQFDAFTLAGEFGLFAKQWRPQGLQVRAR